MIYKLIAKLPPSWQAAALENLPSQKIVAGALVGAFSALLAAFDVYSIPASLQGFVTLTCAVVASWLVPLNPDTPRSKVQRDRARAKHDEEKDLITRIGVAEVQNVAGRRNF